jgi:glutaminyl-tRNA synthetase
MAPPKGVTAISPEAAVYIELFKSIGLTQAKAAEAAKSAKSAALLQCLIERHKLTGGRIDEKQAGLVAALAVQSAKIGEDERGYIVDAIIDGRLKTTDQVNGACVISCSCIRTAHTYTEVYSGGQIPRITPSPSR